MAQPIYGGSAQMPSASSGINLTGSLASGVDVTPGANPNPQYGMLNQPAGSAAQAKPNVAGTTVPPGGPQTGVTPPTPTNTLTSTPANNDYNSLLANIQQRSNDLYTQQQQAIQNQLAAQTSGINASYDARERQMQQQQGEETATNAALQYKFGRAGTAYAASDADKLNALHSQQLNDLAAQRQQLLQQAQNAAMNGNITLSKNLIAQDEQMFNDQMKIQSQMRLNQAQAVKDALNTTKLQSVSSKDIQSQLTNFVKGGVTLDNFSTDDKAQYEQQMGLPAGSFDNYYNALSSAQTATNQAQQAKAANSIISLMTKIPTGQSMTINGNTYTGLGSDKNHQIIKEVDGSGKVTAVTLDKTTGEPIHVADLGKIGKGFKGQGGSGGTGEGATFTKTEQKKLEQAGLSNATRKQKLDYLYGKGNTTTQTFEKTDAMGQTLDGVAGSDSHVSPQDWNKNLQRWKASGENESVFYSKFGKYINPSHKSDYNGYENL